MKSELQRIAEKHSLSFHEDLKEYDLSFDIRNIPNNKITLIKSTPSIEIIASYEFLWGTSEKPSYFAGHNPDKYICWIKCRINNSTLPEFRIIESGVINKWLRKIPMTIYCKDDSFKRKLNDSQQINSIFNKCIETAELSPSISTMTKNETLEVNINFQSFLPYYDIFEYAIEFCHELEKLNS